SSPTTPTSTTTLWWTKRSSSSTSATRPARREPRPRTSTSCEALEDRPGRPRLLGEEPRAEFRRARGPPLDLRRERKESRGGRGALSERARDRRLQRGARRPGGRGRRHRYARPN